jgi:hypothetical protein
VSIYLKDEATSKAVRKPAQLRGTTLTEAVRVAVKEALEKEEPPQIFEKRLKAIKALQEEVRKMQGQGKSRPADKAFFDDLSGDI